MHNLERHSIMNMQGGWFIGNFEPSILKSQEFEIALKRYSKGDTEISHFQEIATEFTLVISGKIRLGKSVFIQDEICEIPPKEPADFECIEDAILIAIKCPSIPSDKRFE